MDKGFLSFTLLLLLITSTITIQTLQNNYIKETQPAKDLYARANKLKYLEQNIQYLFDKTTDQYFETTPLTNIDTMKTGLINKYENLSNELKIKTKLDCNCVRPKNKKIKAYRKNITIPSEPPVKISILLIQETYLNELTFKYDYENNEYSLKKEIIPKVKQECYVYAMDKVPLGRCSQLLYLP